MIWPELEATESVHWYSYVRMCGIDHVLGSDSLPVPEQTWASFVPLKLAPEQVDPVRQQMRRCGHVSGKVQWETQWLDL